MGVIENFFIRIQEGAINSASDDRIRIESVKRSTGSQKSISSNITRASTLFTPKKVTDWKNAVAVATDPERPSLLLLSELYDNLLLDSHVKSVIETRIMRVLSSKFALINASGDANPDLRKLLNRPWFEKFMYQTVESKFTGIKVLEIFETDETGELMDIISIPMGHINPLRQEIVKEAGDETGESYVDGSNALYYAEIGDPRDLGMLADVAPLILAKKKAMGAWLDYIEKYGIPPRIITTDNRDKKRVDELLDMLVNMINNHVAVIQGTEKFEMAQMPQTDAYRVFGEMLKFLNSEISKRFLGQDGTTDHKDSNGTYGSLKVLQGVADDRHESDKLFVQYIINKILLPKLVKISSFYTGLNGHEFDWDESDEMSKKDLVDSVASLAQAGFTMDIKDIAEKTGIPITGFRSNTLPLEDENSKKKSPVT